MGRSLPKPELQGKVKVKVKVKVKAGILLLRKGHPVNMGAQGRRPASGTRASQLWLHLSHTSGAASPNCPDH